MKRMGMVIGIKPERIAEYKKTHAAVWPEVLAKISDCNMRNYTIFLREPENLLFGYFEYHGADWAAEFSQDGGRPEDAGMVGDSQPDADPACLPQRRRLVGHGGGGVSHRLSPDPPGVSPWMRMLVKGVGGGVSRGDAKAHPKWEWPRFPPEHCQRTGAARRGGRGSQ